MKTHLLIDAMVQQTMVLIAQLATAGGVRAPLVRVADQVFADLTTELQNQGVTKKVIADMFGMALRTYHRRVQETRQSRSQIGSTVWAAVLQYIREHEPISAGEVLTRFAYDDAEVVSGALNDLHNSGLATRSGRGDHAVYRAASAVEIEGSDEDTVDWLVWLTTYRQGPISLGAIAEAARLSESACESSVERLIGEDKVSRLPDGSLRSEKFETGLGNTQGWEAAVLDHYQALCAALSTKLSGGSQVAEMGDTVGGSTWSFDIDKSHPLRDEVLHTLRRQRQELESLRERVDEQNTTRPLGADQERVVVYVGQNRVRQ